MWRPNYKTAPGQSINRDKYEAANYGLRVYIGVSNFSKQNIKNAKKKLTMSVNFRDLNEETVRQKSKLF